MVKALVSLYAIDGNMTISAVAAFLTLLAAPGGLMVALLSLRQSRKAATNSKIAAVQVQSNGGSSLKDAVERIEATTERMQAAQTEIAARVAVAMALAERGDLKLDGLAEQMHENRTLMNIKVARIEDALLKVTHQHDKHDLRVDL